MSKCPSKTEASLCLEEKYLGQRTQLVTERPQVQILPWGSGICGVMAAYGPSKPRMRVRSPPNAFAPLV